MDIIEGLLDILVKDVKYEDRLKKAVKNIDKIFEEQMQTNNNEGEEGGGGEKKRKVVKPYIINDMVIEIALFVSYNELINYMLTEKRFGILIKQRGNYFWKKKFKTEFPGYDYPKALNLNKNNWEESTKKLLDEFRRIKGLGFIYRTPKDVFGNELLFFKTGTLNSGYYHSKFAKNWEEFKDPKNLNLQFLLELIERNVMLINEVFDFTPYIKLEGFFNVWDKKKEFLEGIVNILYNRFLYRGRFRNKEINYFTVQKYLFEVYSIHFEEELKNKEILLKLLKMGLFVDKKIYGYFSEDESFYWEVGLIDSFLPTIMNYDKNTMSLFLMALKGLKANRENIVAFSEELKNSYIVNLLAVRADSFVFEYVLPIFRDNLQIAIEVYRIYQNVGKRYATQRVRNILNKL